MSAGDESVERNTLEWGIEPALDSHGAVLNRYEEITYIWKTIPPSKNYNTIIIVEPSLR